MNQVALPLGHHVLRLNLIAEMDASQIFIDATDIKIAMMGEMKSRARQQ